MYMYTRIFVFGDFLMFTSDNAHAQFTWKCTNTTCKFLGCAQKIKAYSPNGLAYNA